jgi:transcriptional regulator with GAF, ATPase, and Fis domain
MVWTRSAVPGELRTRDPEGVRFRTPVRPTVVIIRVMPRLVIKENQDRRVVSLARAVTSIGRAPTSHIPLLDIRASRKHCHIEREENDWLLIDLGSQNGTYVNGTLTDKRELRHGDLITIGSTRILFQDEDDAVDLDSEERTLTVSGLPMTPQELERLERERTNLLRLQRVTQALNSELDLQRLLSLIMDHAVELTDAERGFLVLVKDGALEFEIARSFEQDDLEEPEYSISHSIARKVLTTGDPILSVNAMGDERFNEIHSIETIGLRSVMCLPLRTQDRIVGILYVDNRLHKGVFDDDHMRMLDAFSDQAALAVENARLVRELREKGEALESSNHEIEALNAKLEKRVATQVNEIKRISTELAHRQGEMEHKYSYEEIVGRSSAMQRVFRILDRIIDSDMPVLIEGESGTGKELIARAVHYNGERRRQKFVSENCGAIAETLLESELFGYVRGAFTGADRNRKGLFEQAHRGTLFLDEVGEMSLDMQKKFLRVLQEGRVRPVGAKDEVEADVRIVSASNRNLRALVGAGKFREDLYYRLKVLEVILPPLRERREDIPSLVEHFLKRAVGQEPPPSVDPRVLELLKAYDWPGNVRELENEVSRMVAFSDDVIVPDILSESVRGGRGVYASSLGGEGCGNLAELVARVETSEISRALRMAEGNKTRASQTLGISRFTLQRKLDKYEIEFEEA